jgi:hypothetical protein
MAMYRKRSSDNRPAASRRRRPRFLIGSPGFSMVEVQVALVLFGLALAGFGPYLVMYTKQLRTLQQRFSPQTTYYLVPSSDLWTRKLGAAATFTDQDPGSLPPQGAQAPTANAIQINSLQRSLASEEVTAFITVQATQQ